MLAAPNLLRIPGPTPLPPTVQSAINQPMINHRGDEMYHLLDRVKQDIKAIFGTRSDVLFLSGSGTTGMEAAVTNVTEPGDEVLVVTTGVFGFRFVDICQTHGNKVHQINVEWGQAFDPEEILDYVKENKAIKAVFVTFCDTSTGVLNPIQDLGKHLSSSSDALLVVDGVSSVGGAESKMDQWRVDVFVSGSQKALMLPPGLSFIAVSEKAWKQIKANKKSSVYLDLEKYKESLNGNRTPFTPNISVLYGLKESLKLINQEGLEQVYERHLLMRKMTREALKAVGANLLVSSDAYASPTITAFSFEGIVGDDLRNWLQEHTNLTLAGGLGELQGKWMRIGHMGYCYPSDILQIISLLELGLKHFGENLELGAGVRVAQDILLEDLQKNN